MPPDNGQRQTGRVCRQKRRTRLEPLQTAAARKPCQTKNRVRCRATHPTQRQRPSEKTNSGKTARVCRPKATHASQAKHQDV
ncbi:hypothetical protein [Kingella potus]|uniref:hypothetical protein n=1 Tax=Kingella potus TaxID=265175 RepID=UPI001FD60220|nr:hypothetical protein [Kingella potus]UOP01457.1 hypothetical protein LVJ84_04425 [Kingella potus]